MARVAAKGFNSSSVGIWQMSTGNLVQALGDYPTAFRSLHFSSDGKRLAGGTSGLAIVWDLASGKSIDLRFNSGYPQGLAFSDDGEFLAAAISPQPDGVSRGAKVWNVINAREILDLQDFKGSVYGVAFSPDAKRIASSSGAPTRFGAKSLEDSKKPWGEVQLWDMVNGQKILTIPAPAAVMHVAFSPDGKRLAGASGNDVLLWNAATGDKVLSVKGHRFPVSAVAFSPDGTRLATSSHDNTAKVWDATTGRDLFTLTGHTDWVVNVAFGPDGTRLATASVDGTAKVWDAGTGQELYTLTGNSEPIYDVAFSPDGKYLALASGKNGLIILSLEKL
jgi:WD40 repeat protein